jgi:hypothetical protein
MHRLPLRAAICSASCDESISVGFWSIWCCATVDQRLRTVTNVHGPNHHMHQVHNPWPDL